MSDIYPEWNAKDFIIDNEVFVLQRIDWMRDTNPPNTQIADTRILGVYTNFGVMHVAFIVYADGQQTIFNATDIEKQVIRQTFDLGIGAFTVISRKVKLNQEIK